MLRVGLFVHERGSPWRRRLLSPETEIRRVFRIVETSRHADRNRLALVLSIYAGLRVGEIAALTVGDVAANAPHRLRALFDRAQ